MYVNQVASEVKWRSLTHQVLCLDEELLGGAIDVLRLELELAHQRQAHLRRPQVRQRRGRVRVGAAAVNADLVIQALE